MLKLVAMQLSKQLLLYLMRLKKLLNVSTSKKFDEKLGISLVLPLVGGFFRSKNLMFLVLIYFCLLILGCCLLISTVGGMNNAQINNLLNKIMYA